MRCTIVEPLARTYQLSYAMPANLSIIVSISKVDPCNGRAIE